MTAATIWMFLAILSFFESSTQKISPGAEVCVEDSLKARTFSSLTDYQGTRISFDPKHPGYQGNVVEFSFQQIEELPKNTFVSFGSNNIVKISIDHKQILYIDDGAFLELFCLQELDLSFNNLTSLSEGVFEGLANLKKLYLGHNKIVKFPDLNKLYHLNYLDLSSNRMTYLTRLPALSDLSSLDLSFNKISSITANTFVNLTSLTQLLLNNNHLANIEMEQWNGLNNLNKLNLAANSLASFDTSSVYSFSNLADLNVSSNYLANMNSYHLKRHFPKLTSLDVRKNYWRCIDLDKFITDLKDTKITLASPVNCTEGHIEPVIPVKSSTTTPKSIPLTTTKTSEYLSDIKAQNKLILLSNTGIKDTLIDLYYILVFICVILVVFVTFETLSKLGICNRGYMRLRGHLDGDGAERVLLRG